MKFSHFNTIGMEPFSKTIYRSMNVLLEISYQK